MKKTLGILFGVIFVFGITFMLSASNVYAEEEDLEEIYEIYTTGTTKDDLVVSPAPSSGEEDIIVIAPNDTEEGSKTVEPEKKNVMLYVGIGAAVVVALGCLAFFVSKKKCEK